MVKVATISSDTVSAQKTTTNALSARSHGPRAREVRVEGGQLVLTLSGGAVEGTVISIPIENLPHVRDISAEQLADVRLLGGGSAIFWPAANVDFATYGLIESVTGIRSVRAHMAQAGSARTPAKVAAARENGKKGGRPRKVKDAE